jgi:hypothetical protein
MKQVPSKKREPPRCVQRAVRRPAAGLPHTHTHTRTHVYKGNFSPEGPSRWQLALALRPRGGPTRQQPSGSNSANGACYGTRPPLRAGGSHHFPVSERPARCQSQCGSRATQTSEVYLSVPPPLVACFLAQTRPCAARIALAGRPGVSVLAARAGRLPGVTRQ